MASVSASSLVLFIAAMSLAVAVSGTMIDSVSSISHSVEEKGADVSNQIDTEIEVISDAGSGAVYENDTIVLLVKNTGIRTIPNESEAVDVLVDGRYVSPSSLNLTVVDGGGWREGRVARLTIDRSLASGEHRVSVVAGGETEVFEFVV